MCVCVTQMVKPGDLNWSLGQAKKKKNAQGGLSGIDIVFIAHFIRSSDSGGSASRTTYFCH